VNILRRSLIGGSAATLVAARTAKAQVIGRDGGISAGAIGYTVTVRLDAGPVYTYNPDTPGPNQTATDEGNFVSDFAGFTQRSIHCKRTDTALRVYFRKDISPNPNRIEVILELGHMTTKSSAVNLPGFTLQILKSDVPQPIPYATLANQSGTSTSPHFPSMGWFTRWRWNLTPRAEIRSRASLLPAGLNLLPNFSQSLATTFRCIDCGAGQFAYLSPHYSSAYNGIAYPTGNGTPNDLNPVGVNENCGLAAIMGGVGGRPDLGITTEWQANYVVNGNANAQAAMYALAEVAGGMPWCQRDQSTGAPADLIANPSYSWGNSGFDTPYVSVPSGSGGGLWQLEYNHTPQLSYVPYILTGDPFYLENLQFQANWLVGVNSYHRELGFAVNYADYLNTITALTPNIPLFPEYRNQTRGLAWSIRDWAMAYLATPASVPSWLLPKSYWDQGLTDNATYADKYGTNYNANFPSSPQYPDLELIGQLPGIADLEQPSPYYPYMCLGAGFAIAQAGRSEWLPYYTYFMRSPLAMASGTSGWDYRWPVSYAFMTTPVSTDYEATPGRLSSWTAIWNYHVDNAMLPHYPAEWTIGQGSNGLRPFGSAWAPTTLHQCNCWVCEVRSGIPSLPILGDVISFTISGSFGGLPVTVSHTVSIGDLTIMGAWSIGNLSLGPHPIVDDLVSKINANSSLIAAGITASTTTSTGFQTQQTTGRFFVNFNSATVNPIAISGSWTTTSAGSLYIQPNGDCVYHGSGAAAQFGRPLSYQCAKTGTSGSGGPSGTAFNTAVTDGSTAWCFAPEDKSWPLTTPGLGNSPPAAFPRLMQDFTNKQPYYVTSEWCGMTQAEWAGVPGAAACVANLRAEIDDWYTNVDTSLHNQFNFSIAP
jgi:hypothetical protein